MEFLEVVRRRRMVRNFDGQPVDREVLDRLLDTARRGPSAGFSQGLDLVVLDTPEATARYWAITFPDLEARRRFRWPGLFRAPVLVLPVTDRAAYLERYGLADKSGAGLDREDAWPVPYWDVDAGMATMLLLLAAVDAGLGAAFFGLFAHAHAVATAFGIPAGHVPIGTVALGHPAPDEPGRSAATIARRPLDQVVHRGVW